MPSGEFGGGRRIGIFECLFILTGYSVKRLKDKWNQIKLNLLINFRLILPLFRTNGIYVGLFNGLVD